MGRIETVNVFIAALECCNETVDSQNENKTIYMERLETVNCFVTALECCNETVDGAISTPSTQNSQNGKKTIYICMKK